ncbi:MAG: Zn-dependent hydrolase [Parcubacteria group bacterium Gr01-1014_56]|nr:MAG: Zn-dependent hydrolase [Parcubacteria group bacterium Gr01-1014_56]
MVITYMGGECFKVSQGELTIALNPPSKDSKLKTSKFGSDIVLSTLNNEDFSGVENASFGEREPFAIVGPGEYEVRGVAVRGFAGETEYEGKKGINTIYSIALEGMNLCFLGALSNTELPHAAQQELDDIDVLFLPIGGEGVLDHASAYKLAVQLEPRAIIPMHYGELGGKDSLKSFLKEAGSEDVKPIEKLTIKKKDLEGKEGEIIVLSV